MKKIFAFLLCIVLLCALPTIAYAEETATEVVTEEETAPEEAAPLPEESVPEAEKAVTELIKEYVIAHLEEISVIITMILSVFYQVRKHGALNKSVATLNNNAVTVAEDSKSAISQALTDVSGVSTVVSGFTEQMASLLDEIRLNAEEKKRLESALNETENYLKTAKLANIEFANELAELLVLANIPNAKKEELYQRHRTAVASIAEAEKTTEVKENVGEEA